MMKLNKDQIAALRALEDADGRLSVDDVVAEAKRSSSPLHELFPKMSVQDWAYEAQKQWGREVITSYKLVITTTTYVDTLKGYVHNPNVGKGENGYISTVSIKSDRDACVSELTTEVGRARTILDNQYRLAEYWEFDAALLRAACDHLSDFLDALRAGKLDKRPPKPPRSRGSGRGAHPSL